MKLVIDIPKAIYESTKTDLWCGSPTVGQAIANGIILPKGCGRLIDADETLKAMDTWDKFGYTETGHLVRNPGDDYVPYVHYEDMVKAVNGMPTIVEGDKKAEKKWTSGIE